MKQLVGLLLTAICCAFPCMQGNAQPPLFENYYELGATDEGYDICEAPEGGFVIVAERRISLGTSNLVVMKIDSSGQTNWIKSYGNSGYHKPVTIAPCIGGGYIISGQYETSDIRYFPWVLRIDSVGDTLWTKNILTPWYPTTSGGLGNGICKSVFEAYDGTFYALSQVADTNISTCFLAKLNANGDTIWTRQYDWGNGPGLYGMAPTLDSSIAIYGQKIDSMFPYVAHVLLMKLDLDGDTSWTKVYRIVNAVTSPSSVVQTADSGFFLSGGVIYNSGTGVDYFVVRTDKYGDTLWTKTYGGVGCNDGGPGIQCSDGSYLLSGLTLCQGAGMQDLYLVKLDTSGNFVWDRTYGGASDDRANSILQTNDGGFIASGISCSFGFGNCDVYVVKTDSNGIAPTGFLPIAPPQNHFVIYPNPTNGIVFIDYSIPQNENGILEVYSITGALLFTEMLAAGSERMQFDWCAMEPGMYLVRMITNDNATDVERIIITE